MHNHQGVGLTLSAAPRLSDREYDLLCSLIHAWSGLTFDAARRPLVESRLRRRCSALNLTSYADYFRILRREARERALFIDLLTVNETFFYRNPEQIRLFCRRLLPRLLETAATARRTLRLLSAGCSVGCEPATLALELLESQPVLEPGRVEIVGVDISKSAIAVARAGLYTPREIRAVPPAILRQRFHWDGRHYQLADEVQRTLTFFEANLVDRESLRVVGPVDAIFCRNVLIYFDARSRHRVLENLYGLLNRGGTLFVNHTEFTAVTDLPYRLEEVDGTVIYTK